MQLYRDRPIPGPYKQSAREAWLRKVLEAQQHIRENGPEEVRDIDLITMQELETIRQIWVVEKHEIEDSLPAVYEEATGRPYPSRQIDDNLVLGSEEVELLRELSGTDELHFELVRELLSVERRHKSMLRRAGLFKAFESAFRRGSYDDEDDAIARARQRRDMLERSLKRISVKEEEYMRNPPVVIEQGECEQ